MPPLIGLGELLGLAAAFAWAVTGLLVRAHGAAFPAITVNALRSTIAGSLFIAAWAFLGNRQPIPRDALVFLFSSLIVGVVVGDTLYFEALKRIGVARAMPISMGYPVLTVILAAVLLDEPFGPRAVVGMLLTLGGVYLVALPSRAVAAASSRSAGGQPYWHGVALAAIAAVAWSASTLLLRPALAGVDVITASALRMPIVAGILWLVAARVGALPRRSSVTRRAVLIVGTLGLTTVVATFFFLQSVALAGAGRAAVVTATAPLWGVPLSMLFLRERGTWRLAVGTLISVLGVILLS